MAINRKMIGEPIKHKGHLISVHHLGPDLLVRIDGQEMPNFYMTSESAKNAGKRHIDLIEKENKHAVV